jgi:predicted TIM-barrel fold metal-dependent hydrolase
MLKMLKRSYGQMPQHFTRDPIETFQDKVFVAPYYEEDMVELKDSVPANRMLFGSDWPHPEGLELPLDYLNEVKAFSPAEQEMFMSSNLKGLLEGRR